MELGKNTRQTGSKPSWFRNNTFNPHWSIGGIDIKLESNRRQEIAVVVDTDELRGACGWNWGKSRVWGQMAVCCCVLTGWLKGFGSEGRMCRCVIIAWSRSLSFASCRTHRFGHLWSICHLISQPLDWSNAILTWNYGILYTLGTEMSVPQHLQLSHTLSISPSTVNPFNSCLKGATQACVSMSNPVFVHRKRINLQKTKPH